MNRLLVEAEEVDAANHVRLSDGRARHLLEVLQVAPGDGVRVGVLDGPKGEGRVEAVEGRMVTLHLNLESERPPRPALDLILALPRPKVLARMWAPLAALGIGHLALTNAWRVERNYFDTHLLREEGFVPLFVEGLQQAGDTRLPTVSVHKRLVPLMEDGLSRFGDAARLIAHPGGERVGPALAGLGDRRVLLAIGPEGGWIDRELALFARCGFVHVGLGERVLRTDVAAVALLSLVHDALRGQTLPL